MIDENGNPKRAPKPKPKPHPKPKPYIFWALALIAPIFLGGCVGPMAKIGESIPERIEAMDLAMGTISDRITAATCTQFKAKRCVEPGKPLDPDDAKPVHKQIERAHATLMTVNAFGTGGVGECLGKVRSQAACLSALDLLLTEIDRMLILKGGQ